MNNVLNQNGNVLEETVAGPNSDAVKLTLRGLRNFKMTLSLFKFLKRLSQFLCYFVTYNRKY